MRIPSTRAIDTAEMHHITIVDPRRGPYKGLVELG